MIWPNICDDKQCFAKYSRKKLPEIRDDKRFLALNTAELLPNIYDNHQIHRQANLLEGLVYPYPFGCLG